MMFNHDDVIHYICFHYTYIFIHLYNIRAYSTYYIIDIFSFLHIVRLYLRTSILRIVIR